MSRFCNWCARNQYGCKAQGCISDECKAELIAYVKDEGRTWRSKLKNVWTSSSSVLRELRNTVGPSKLSRVKPTRRLL